MSILKTNEIQPNTAGSLTITGNTTTTGTSSVSGDVTVAGVLSGSVVSGTFHGDGSNLTNVAGGASLTVQEQDGTPLISNVTSLKFTNGTITDNGNGVASVYIETSASWFHPKSTSISPAKMSPNLQQTHSIGGQLFNPTTTFSSSNPAIVNVVSQTYVSSNAMDVVLSSSATTGSITLYAYNGARLDDGSTSISNNLNENPPLVYFDFEEGSGTSLGNKSNTTFTQSIDSTINNYDWTDDFTYEEYAQNITASLLGTFLSGTSVRGTHCGYFDGSYMRGIQLPEWPMYQMLDMAHTDGSGSFTISVWVRGLPGGAGPKDWASGGVVDHRGWDHDGDTGFGLSLQYSYGNTFTATKKCGQTNNAPTMRTYGDITGFAYTSGSVNMAADTWYHLVYTCNGATGMQKLYHNGWLSQTITDDGYANTKIKYSSGNSVGYCYNMRTIAGANNTSAEGYYLYAGYNTNNDPKYYGLMDEFALFDYYMTADQVAWMYNSGSPPSLADGVPVSP